jgi:hypothetical protein
MECVSALEEDDDVQNVYHNLAWVENQTSFRTATFRCNPTDCMRSERWLIKIFLHQLLPDRPNGNSFPGIQEGN